MKKFLTILLTALLLVNISTPAAKANTSTIVYSEIEYISEDLYLEIEIEEYTDTMQRATQTKTAAKKVSLKNSSNTTVATFTIIGTFTYDGTTSKCTAASHSSTISDNTWAFTFKTANRLTNRAIGQYIIDCTINGQVVQKLSDSVILACAPDGTLS